jgi:hypothetical protein
LLLAMMLLSAAVLAQSDQRGKILKWDIAPYGKHGHVTRNAAIYYIQIGKTVYQVTRGTTGLPLGAVSGAFLRRVRD